VSRRVESRQMLLALEAWLKEEYSPYPERRVWHT
jgi:hypothetical protein